MNSREVFFYARLTVLLVALSMVTAVQADPRQWDVDGVAVRQGAEVGGYSTAQNADGYTLIVWNDLRSGSNDIYAQLLNPAGAPQWVAGGVRIVDHPAGQVNPMAVAVTGGWIVFWIDYRNYVYHGEELLLGNSYAQKLDASGNLVWSDNDFSGVRIDAGNPTIEYLVTTANDGSGGALIGWSAHNPSGDNAYAQHIDGNGALLWLSPLQAVIRNPADFGSFVGAGDDSGHLFFACTERPSGQSARVWAAKITPQGTRAWGDSGKVVTATARYQKAAISPDREGGCYLAWTTGDIYTQRLNATGDAMWQAGGIPVCEAPFEQCQVALAPSCNGSSMDGCVIAWCDRRSGGSDFYYDVYAQKISPSGQAQWAANGVNLGAGLYGMTAGNFYDAAPRVISDQAGGMIAVWNSSEQDYSNQDLFGNRITANGTPLWGTDCVPVCTTTPSQYPALLSSSPNGIFAFWKEFGSETSALRYQHLDMATGGRTFSVDGVTLHSGIVRSAGNPQSLMLAPGRYAIVWEDNRPYYWGNELYYQILDTDGQPEGPVNGRPLRNNPADSYRMQEQPKLCSDGSGGFFVGYIDCNTGISLAKLSHVNAAGVVTSPDTGAYVFPDVANYGATYVVCLSDNQNGCYVATALWNLQWVRDIWIQRMNSACQLMWTQPVQLTNSTEEDIVIGLTPGTNGSCIVFWWHGRDINRNLSSSCIRPDGTIAWTTSVYDDSASNSRLYDEVILSDNDGGFFCAWQKYTPTAMLIYVQHINSDGQALWQTNGMPVSPEAYVHYPQIAQDRYGNLFVAWWNYLSPLPSPIMLQKINPAGELMWGDSGRQVCSDAREMASFSIMADAGDGLFVCWTDEQQQQEYSHIYETHLDSAGVPVADPYWASGGGLISSSWDNQNNPLLCPDGYGGMVVVYEDRKAIDTDGGISQIYAQRVWDGFTSVPEPPPQTPLVYTLHQNYPNPFNPATVIAFELPHAGHATLEVFDLLGRHVTSLINDALPSGSHQVRFDGANLPSGIYLYRLQAADFTQTRKMILLK